MTEQSTKVIESCDIKEKPHHLDKGNIMSYLSFLEKIYQNQNCEKTHQKRILRINKALNSLKKYSDFYVSPFQLKKSSIPKDDKKVNDECANMKEKEKKDEEKDIEKIICLIEKELKLNGIDANDINNNSFLSTNVKSENTDSTPSDKNDNSDKKDPDTKAQKTKKRLSKLFMKIEMKLKTYLQEEQDDSSKAKLINDQDIINGDKNNGQGDKINESNNKKLKLSKRPSQLPELENSFFSDKKKIETMLLQAKKQKRKSMVALNAMFLFKEKKDDKEVLYIEDSLNKNGKRKASVPCTALIHRPKKKKIKKNTDDKFVSNFNFDKIDEKEEFKENEEVVPFAVIKEKKNEDEKDYPVRIMQSQTPLFINEINSSFKINSTINRNKIDVDQLNKEKKKYISLYPNESSSKVESNNMFDSPLLDDDLFIHSSDKEANSNNSNDSNEEDEKSISSDSCDNEEEKEEKSNGSEKSNKSSGSESDDSGNKTSNFDYFCRHSIFSPLRELQDDPQKHNELVEQFRKMNL